MVASKVARARLGSIQTSWIQLERPDLISTSKNCASMFDTFALSYSAILVFQYFSISVFPAFSIFFLSTLCISHHMTILQFSPRLQTPTQPSLEALAPPKLVARCWLKSWLRTTNFSTWTSPTTPSALRRPSDGPNEHVMSPVLKMVWCGFPERWKRTLGSFWISRDLLGTC